MSPTKTTYQSFSGLCPLCQEPLLREDFDGNVAFSCSTCRCHPYSKYYLIFDVFRELYSVSMVIESNNKSYAIAIRFDMNKTWMEEVSSNGKDAYWIPITVMEIHEALPFDIINPIESIDKIFKKLFALRVFS